MFKISANFAFSCMKQKTNQFLFRKKSCRFLCIFNFIKPFLLIFNFPKTQLNFPEASLFKTDEFHLKIPKIPLTNIIKTQKFKKKEK